MSEADLDLIVIGSGPAGEKGAAQAAYFGKRVALVERQGRPGGAPVNSGGLPTKTLRETALYLTGFRRREVYGIGLDLTPDLTLDRLRARAAAVSELAGGAVRANLDRHGIELVHGVARLDGGGIEVDLADGGMRSLRSRVVLIATGSRPYRPAEVPFDDPDVHDSDTILGIDRIPASLVVIGGGPVGCEYASIFTALDVRVTLVDRAERLMPLLDVDASEQLRACFADMGMRLLLSAPHANVERVRGRLRVSLTDGQTLEPDMVLFAAGRSGNTEELGLEAGGVALDARGRIIVDAEYRTAAAGIYAAGDVIGPPALASVSAEQGRVAMCHAFDIPFKETVDALPPFGIYSIPEVAMVGLTEEAATEAGIAVVSGRSYFAGNPRSLIAGSTNGFLKLVFRRDDRRLLGVHIVGEEAAELIHVGQAVIHAGETIDRFIHTTFNIPTRAEVYKYAAYDGLQQLAGRSLQGRAASLGRAGSTASVT
jgi:NAD(P) transhydrogenase